MDWRVLVLITVLLWGSYGVILKAVADRIDPAVSMLWFVAGYAAVVAFYMAATIGTIRQKAFEPAWFWPLVCGVIGGVGAITYFRVLPLAKGSAVMPLIGLYMVITAVGCIIFLREPVDARVIVGIVCAGAAVVLLGK